MNKKITLIFLSCLMFSFTAFSFNNDSSFDGNLNSSIEITNPDITITGDNPQTIEVGAAYSELNATALDVEDGDITGDIVIDASAVVIGTVGSYNVTYTVVDSNANSVTETRVVNVVDTTLPTITLTGADPQIIEVGTAYSELGATASDNYDDNGVISGNIVIDASAVNTNVVASYTVTYNVVDANTNNAVEVTRTVNVIDTTDPVITLTGADPQIIEVGTAYSELGATASDNHYGDISGSLVIDSNSVDTNVVASYSVTYNVDDANSNSATQVTRTVNVVDTTIPVITLIGANPQVLEVEDAYTELNATASDNHYGDISGSIVIDASGVVAGTIGSYSVTYNVDDVNSLSATEVTRAVNVVDTTDPTAIAIAGPIDINLNGVTSITPQDVDNGSSDNYVAGGITLSLDQSTFSCDDIVAGQVSTPVTVTLTVTDSSNNTATASVVVNVIDDVIPMNVALVNPTYVHPTATPYVEQGFTQDEVCVDGYTIVSSDLDVNQWGTYTIVYKVLDKSGNESAEITRTQVVNNVPTTDVANYKVNQDTENHVFDVLAGDSFGPDGPESFTISGAMSAQNGTLILNDNGTTIPTDDTVIYSPFATYNGPDSFSYTLEDENGDTATRTVHITVRPIVPVPVDDSETFDKNSSNNIISVLDNDDFGGNEAHAQWPLTFTNGSKISASIEGGAISIEDNGTPLDLTDDVILYSPALDFTGADSFMYTITDSDGDATNATVTITVVEGANGNHTPTAVADSATVHAGSTSNIIDVLDNDSPGTDGYINNGLTLTNGTSLGASANGGVISVNRKGTASTLDDEFEYSAPLGFDGTDTFSYTITDASGDASTALVTVTVNVVTDVPVAMDDTLSVLENSGATSINVTANDSFGTDGPAIIPFIINSPDHITGTTANGGTFALDDKGNADVSDDEVSYTPALNFVGEDSFQYTIRDADLEESIGTVTVTVGPLVVVNGTPTALDDTASVAYGSSANIITILANDTYGSDGPTSAHEPLSLVNGKQVTASINGADISVSDNGTPNDKTDDVVLYSAPSGFSGTDSFTYSITDATGDAATGTVTITVAAEITDVPLAVDDTLAVLENSGATSIDVTANDNFGTDGAAVVPFLINSLDHITGTTSNGGTFALDDNGTVGDASDDKVTYTPAANYTGPDSFQYTIRDANGDESIGTVTITVGPIAPVVVDTPTALDDAASVAHNSTNNVIDVLDNDSFGTDGAINGGLTMTNGTLVSASVNGGDISIDTKGTLDTLDDEFLYSAPTNFSGVDTFMYTITDASGDASTGTVTVTVGVLVMDSPTAVDDVFAVAEDSMNNDLAILSNGDSFGDDGASSITLSGATSSAGGLIFMNDNALIGDPTDDTVTYTPLASFVGTDTFTYTLEDGNGDIATATVSIAVGTVPVLSTTPTAVDDTVSVPRFSMNNLIDVMDNDDFGADGKSATHPLTLSNGRLTGTSTGGRFIEVHDSGTPLDFSDDTVSYSPGSLLTDSFEYTITDGNGDATTGTVNITTTAIVIKSGNSVTIGNNEIFENSFLSYPNPSKGLVNTTLLSSINTEAIMILSDVTGKVVYRSRIDIQTGTNQLEFNFTVKPGVMLMKIISKEVDFGTAKVIFK